MKLRITLLLLLIIIMDYRLTEAKRRKKRTDVQFDSDTDVKQYLQNRKRDMMIFKCKKVVMVQWLHSVVPYVDLECEVVGEVSGVRWFFNDTLLQTAGAKGRHISLSQPHYRKRIFFNTWFDYKLRLLHVTSADNGPYTLEIQSPSGHIEHRDIMLDVMTDYREDKWMEWIDGVEKERKELRSRRKAQKKRQRELMRQIRKRAKERKNNADNPLIFD